MATPIIRYGGTYTGADATPEAAAARQAADMAKYFPTPVAAPVVTTPTASAVATTPARTPSLLEIAEKDAADAAASRASARQQADLYAAQQRQSRIDAINTTFAPRISRAKEEGDQRLSRVAALNFKTGTLGSGVDATRSGEQRDLNEKEVRAIEDQKAMAISEAFGWADKLATERASEIYNDSKDAAAANVDRYKSQADTAMKALDTFGAQNVTGEQLKIADPRTYETLRDVSGMSDAEIDAYLKTKAPAGTYQWSAAQVNGSTMYVPKMVNGVVTMEKVDLGYTPKPGYKTTEKLSNGQVVMIFDDGSYKTIGGTPVSPGTQTTKEGAPTWEQFLGAAEDAAKAEVPNSSNVSFSDKAKTELKKLYDQQYSIIDTSDLTADQKKRLEQAGLLGASRQDQLNHLYKNKGDVYEDF